MWVIYTHTKWMGRIHFSPLKATTTASFFVELQWTFSKTPGRDLEMDQKLKSKGIARSLFVQFVGGVSMRSREELLEQKAPNTHFFQVKTKTLVGNARESMTTSPDKIFFPASGIMVEYKGLFLYGKISVDIHKLVHKPALIRYNINKN